MKNVPAFVGVPQTAQERAGAILAPGGAARVAAPPYETRHRGAQELLEASGTASGALPPFGRQKIRTWAGRPGAKDGAHGCRPGRRTLGQASQLAELDGPGPALAGP